MSNSVSASRCAAFDVLLEIETKQSRSDSLLAQYGEALSDIDRNLCHELVLGVLRRKLYLDRVVSFFAKREAEKFDQEVLIALRLGLYQLFSLERIPAFSAINESVNLVKRAKKTSAAPLVNAVLRKATRETEISLSFADEIEEVSVMQSHPRWLIERWIKQFGFEDSSEIAKANNLASPTTFRLTRKSDVDILKKLRDSGAEFSESEVVEGCYRISKRSNLIEEFSRRGEILFQEEGSQLVGQLVGLKATENFLDVCASPGGKATLNSKLADENVGNGNTNAIRIAGDFSRRRVELLKVICERVGEKSICVVAHDATKQLPYRDGAFNVVFLDAPCSGTGTIRSNPEIRYSVKENDFADFRSKQISMLQNAAPLVKQGGRLVFSTCSLERDENEEVVGEFLRLESAFRVESFEEISRFKTKEGFTRTFPHRDGTDGFFVANLQRVSV